MSTDQKNRLREVREGAGIQLAALASSTGVNERTLTRIETTDGTSRLEIKARVVTGLNSLLDAKTYKTEDIFPGWSEHRRVTKRGKGNTSKGAKTAAADAS